MQPAIRSLVFGMRNDLFPEPSRSRQNLAGGSFLYQFDVSLDGAMCISVYIHVGEVGIY